MSENNTYTFKVFYGDSGLEALRPLWEELQYKVANRMYSHSPNWYCAYLNHLTDAPNSLLFSAIFKAEKLVAVIPLENKIHSFSGFNFKVLCLPLHPHFGLRDFVICEHEPKEVIFAYFFKELKRLPGIQWDLIYLKGILEGSVTDNCISTASSSLRFKVKDDFCDVLPIKDYEDIHEKLSKNFRGALRKARNKLGRKECVEFKTSHAKDELQDLFSIFLDVESSGWKGANGTGSAIKLNENLAAFYRQTIEGFSADNEVEINVLEVDSIAIAAQLAFVIDGHVYLLKIGFDEEYSKLAPGNMLLEQKLKDYHRQGNAKSINLITGAKWHSSWNPVMVPKINYYVCNHSLGGICFAIMCHVKKSWSWIFARKNK